MRKASILFVVAVVALLVSCKKGGKDLEQPHADITVTGTVMTEDAKPINGLRLIVEAVSITSDDTRILSTDTLYSDAKGAISLKRDDLVYEPTNVVVYIDDIDGANNMGEFQSAMVILSTKKIAEGDGKYLGAFESTFDVKMQLEEE